MGNEVDKDLIDLTTFIKRYWHFLSIIFGLIVALTYHVIELQQAHKSISGLIENNTKLVNQITELNIRVKELYDFTPPQPTRRRLDNLDFRTFGRIQDESVVEGRGSASYSPVK